jgi:transcriptional regulator with XRE-family HTH domain
MRGKWVDLLYSETRIVPNKFTVSVGKLIKAARIEANISQEELAERAYLKQSSISKIEAGMRSLSAEDILYLSYALDKPVGYFFAKEFTEELGGEEVKILEEELLLQARRLSPDDLKKLIAQSRALADFDNKKKR